MSSLRVLIPAEKIQERIIELGAQIDRDYPTGPVYLVGVLKGACMFMADLARAMKTPARLEFVVIASYGKGKTSSGEARLMKDLDHPIEGGDGPLVLNIAGIQSCARFQQQNVGFLRRVRKMFNTMRNDDEFAGADCLFTLQTVCIANLHMQLAVYHHEQLIFRIVVMPHELALELHEFYLEII